jgi:hypothetical protein
MACTGRIASQEKEMRLDELVKFAPAGYGLLPNAWVETDDYTGPDAAAKTALEEARTMCAASGGVFSDPGLVWVQIFTGATVYEYAAVVITINSGDDWICVYRRVESA